MASKVNRRRFPEELRQRGLLLERLSRLRGRPLLPRILPRRLLSLCPMPRPSPPRLELARSRSAAVQRRK